MLSLQTLATKHKGGGGEQETANHIQIKPLDKLVNRFLDD